MEVLKVTGLTRKFGSLEAVKDVSLTLSRGERRGLIGPNGAGKTTLFSLITGALKPSAGEVHIFGQNARNTPPSRRVALGLARSFQITSLFAELTVLENVQLAVQALKPFRYEMLRPLARYRSVSEESENLLREWGLWDRKDLTAKYLSYGEQRLMELVLCLASHPRILLLDEPTAGLSAAEAGSIVNAIRKVGSEITLFIIEHDMDVIFDIADSITVLHEGRVLAHGEKEAIRHDRQVQEVYLGVRGQK
ncbi:MAG: ABC transporter ATP-binding protein [Chloroflexi bacterium]|nr:ABC transporter ATP-binding protein [Chloroflexota bacterium]